MKASWRHLGIILISTQAVGCFGVRYRDSMALPTCDATCQAAAAESHGRHGRADQQQHQTVAYDQPMIPPRPKFHPVPTRPAFAPRVEYSPPELIRTPVLVEIPSEPALGPLPAMRPIPAEPLMTPPPMLAPPAHTTPPPVEVKVPQPLPPPTVHARPIIAPLPQQIDLDQPNEIRPIQSVWRTKQSS